MTVVKVIRPAIRDRALTREANSEQRCEGCEPPVSGGARLLQLYKGKQVSTQVFVLLRVRLTQSFSQGGPAVPVTQHY